MRTHDLERLIAKYGKDALVKDVIKDLGRGRLYTSPRKDR